MPDKCCVCVAACDGRAPVTDLESKSNMCYRCNKKTQNKIQVFPFFFFFWGGGGVLHIYIYGHSIHQLG